MSDTQAEARQREDGGAGQNDEVLEQTAQLIAESERANVAELPNVIYEEDLVLTGEPLADREKEKEKETELRVTNTNSGIINLDFAKFKPREVPVLDDPSKTEAKLLGLIKGCRESGSELLRASAEIATSSLGMRQGETPTERGARMKKALEDLDGVAGGEFCRRLFPLQDLSKETRQKSSEFRQLGDAFRSQRPALWAALDENRYHETFGILDQFSAQFERLERDFPAKRQAALERAKAVTTEAVERQANQDYSLLRWWETIKEKVAGPTVEDVIGDLMLLSKGGLQDDKRIRIAQAILLSKLTDLMRDAKFEKREKEICSELAHKLAGDEGIKAARDNWENLDGHAKLETLRRIAGIQAEQLGLRPPPAIAFAPEEDREKGLAGYLNEQDGNIYAFFASESGEPYPFDEMFDTIVHEMTHVRQRRLAQLYREGKLTNDPERTMGMIFAANFSPGLYISGSKDDPVGYSFQPVEFHAKRNAPETLRIFNKEVLGKE